MIIQLRIHINRRCRHAQREIRLHEAGPVVIEETIRRDRRAPLEGLVIPELNEPPPLRIQLPERTLAPDNQSDSGANPPAIIHGASVSNATLAASSC